LFKFGGLEALFGGLRPQKPPRGDGTGATVGLYCVTITWQQIFKGSL